VIAGAAAMTVEERPESVGPLEKLHGALMFLSGIARPECAQVSPLAGFGVCLPRIQAVLSAFESSDHNLEGCKFRSIAVSGVTEHGNQRCTAITRGSRESL
jgi:hypothetical protein